jgi:CMP/dCMP kinase
MIITIDGPIATGKSSIAKKLAQDIGYIYFDTGAMYRCLTYALLRRNVNLDDHSAIAEVLNNFKFDIKIKHRDRFYFVDEEDVTLKIRGSDVTANVSKVSAIPFIRTKLVTLQQELAVGVNAVFEGRDMGTTVFPDAKLKIFLTGRPEVRAVRRFEELRNKFPEETKNLTLEEVSKNIAERDDYDTKREASPLRKADDAYVIDTSDLTIDEVIFKILECKDNLKTRNKSTHTLN